MQNLLKSGSQFSFLKGTGVQTHARVWFDFRNDVRPQTVQTNRTEVSWSQTKRRQKSITSLAPTFTRFWVKLRSYHPWSKQPLPTKHLCKHVLMPVWDFHIENCSVHASFYDCSQALYKTHGHLTTMLKNLNLSCKFFSKFGCWLHCGTCNPGAALEVLRKVAILSKQADNFFFFKSASGWPADFKVAWWQPVIGAWQERYN